jgi:C-terminal processing protease CtpA/Prc
MPRSKAQYKDDPEEADEADGGGLDSPRSRGNTRSYSSVHMDEEDPVVRLRRRHAEPSGFSSALTCCWLCFVFLLIIAAAGLVAWRYEMKTHPEGIHVMGNESWIHNFFQDDDSSRDDDDDVHVADARKKKASSKDSKSASAMVEKAIPSGSAQASIHYDPKAALHYYNPFDFAEGDWYGSVVVPPPALEERSGESRLGFFMQPDHVGQHLVFVTEGDLYYTQLDFGETPSASAAMKLTTTVGNVRTPVLNPKYPYYVAFTATYTGHREVYLMDLRPSHRSQPAMRLTYWDTQSGISSVVGWKDDGLTLVFAASSNEIGLPDTRLYEMSLQQKQPSGDGRHRSLQDSGSMQVLKISPVPLAQAIDGAWKDDCVYFTRFQQSSNTARYVGGTAESLWAYCEGQSEAVPLTADYPGTSKHPRIAFIGENIGLEYLFFMSDRDTTNGVTPATMNLFAVPLPTENQLYGAGAETTLVGAIALTHASCDFKGLALQEYSIDAGSVVLRIGADLHLLPKDSVFTVFSKIPSKFDTKELDIVVYSDFHEHQERILPVSMPADMTSFDVFETAFGSTAALLGVRGQLFVAPVVPNTETISTDYAGAGMNLPPRRYRVAPGTTTGGAIRVLCANFVPLAQEDGKTTRRLAVILATDPSSPTAEHGFYMIETQADSVPSFVDFEALPEPFLGGSKGGGSIAAGGLGSIDADSVKVSPCGRRMAWSDTDGRICVMTMPMYQEGKPTPQYKVLPNVNDNGEPLLGIESEFTWSPGGRYLAIGHQAKNQFEIITIVDCGDPNIEGASEVADIALGSIVQATPSRFNSGNPYWGKTGMDFATAAQAAALAALTEQKPPNTDGATALFFLSDRDVVTDVNSPWGTRAPSPHFPTKQSVYALPLTAIKDDPLSPMKGIYAGGGAAELWADGFIDLRLQLKALTAANPTAEPKGRRLNESHLLAAAAARSQRANQQARRLVDWAQNPAVPAELDTPEDLDIGTEVSGEVAGTEVPIEVPTVEAEGLASNSAETPIDQLPAVGSEAPVAGDSTLEPETILVTSFPSSAPSLSPSSTATPPPSSAAPTTSTQVPSSGPSSTPSFAPSQAEPSSVFPNDREIDFGAAGGLEFARKAYRISGIPAGHYRSIVCQFKDDPSLLLVESGDKGPAMTLFAFEDFPSDKIEAMPIFPSLDYMGSGVSTTRNHLLFIFSGLMKVVPNSVESVIKMMADTKMESHIVDTLDMSISIWPSLEYEQIFNDAWRLLRDYFYDTNMNGIDWVTMHTRYKDLVKRCSKREELDNVLAQMAAELSALHVFVYGGEYGDPTHGNEKLKKAYQVASLGASFERSVAYKGYVITSIADRDPDYSLMDGKSIYSPLSDQVLALSGQRGLEAGDVIVGINGESVMRVPDMHMLLRGMAGRSVRLDVLRQPDSRRRQLQNATETADLKPTPVIAVPLSQKDGDNLRYSSWEWRTREKAQALAKTKAFSVGYVHMRSMEGPEDMDAFARGFFSDYDKQALIIDVRHNRGGNIDSWLLDILQRKAWMFWQGRATSVNNGGLGWDQQFAFRGHIVVLIDEKTSSDGEGFSRGVSELGLGRLVGTRTWGGGIWLSSDNHLVDGGIATAPEIGTYNDNFGWGLGIEQQGVEPDVTVDNNPRVAFDGGDQQLEKAIDILAQWLQDEPIVMPKAPAAKRDMSLKPEVENCAAK